LRRGGLGGPATPASGQDQHSSERESDGANSAEGRYVGSGEGEARAGRQRYRTCHDQQGRRGITLGVARDDRVGPRNGVRRDGHHEEVRTRAIARGRPKDNWIAVEGDGDGDVWREVTATHREGPSRTDRAHACIDSWGIGAISKRRRGEGKADNGDCTNERELPLHLTSPLSRPTTHKGS